MSETLSVRVPDGTKEKLDRIGEASRRTRSFLASEAIASFIEREFALIEGLEAGLADMRAGDVLDHDEAMRRVRGAIAARPHK
ncbi:CopG family transcriptional regulator [Acuticoccus sediminis]|uniref:CopG family transcriptional regulator n=1 Tax=Acuticoccus sediminis TaxID=2184697 RepID=A0A8B2NEI7_9HYPH|nr:CopG family ribbon-helix-helix protein [Acuticoccus sediminis]RAH95651.1 CopG family transcriptional regulator [Acuticoccus sediminis]